jgi:hypothetical protein
MSYGNDYFRRELQAFGATLGPFSGKMIFALNGGRACKLELLHRAKFQCTHQGRNEWKGPNATVVLTLGGAPSTARKSFEVPLRERQGDHSELVADFSDGHLDTFFLTCKAR